MTLKIMDGVMNSSSLSSVTLTDLTELQTLTFGQDSCTNVTWFQLNLPPLTTFSIGEGAFNHCQQLLLQFVPELLHFTINDNSFADTSLVIYCSYCTFYS